jgi:shikimate kinase
MNKLPTPPPVRFFLIGFMGSGKSYVGKKLAELIGLEFIDLDEMIIQKAQKTIPEIFQEYGESHFRNLERECLFETQNFNKTIIATGGGTPCFFKNMEWMNSSGVTIYLNVATPILVNRLRKEIHGRPLIASKSEEELSEFINQKLIERQSFYEMAHITYHIRKGNEPIFLELESLFDKMSF